jgi:hypothetical protein
MGIRRLRSETGMPIEDFTNLKPGSDPTDAINRLYADGRKTYGQPNPDAPRVTTPKFTAPTPRDDGSGSYALGKNSPVSPAPSESECQFRDDKVATHNDASGWVRGMGGQSPHPAFDRRVSGAADHKYRK